MSTDSSSLTSQLETLARGVGLSLIETGSGTDFTGNPTTRATFAQSGDPSKTTSIELSNRLDWGSETFRNQLRTYFVETAERLKNPCPDCYLTLLGIPLSFSNFVWPFHASTSGADTFIVHGEAWLQNGEQPVLHAKVSASMTRTFAEVVAALEQPFAEGFVYNAVRKTLDQGQLELVKSGNRQPVPVTTRYYSAKQNRFIFNDTDAKQRYQFVAGKVFWLSHVLGNDKPVWIADPRDAQYLNTTPAELNAAAATLVSEGLIQLTESGWAVATGKLTTESEVYTKALAEGLAFTKPSFNEEMRAGHTNM